MSLKKICDHCQGIINLTDEYVNIDYRGNKSIRKHYHIDCFNRKFSCDIRKIEELE